MDRKLASIQKVKALNPIEGADRIELATILGWKVIVEKGDYAVGDECIFFEIDSVLPSDNEYFNRLEKYNHRVRTQKMRGTVSQGMLAPFAQLPDFENIVVKEGDDVTEAMGVTLYEQPQKFFAGSPAGSFPTDLVPKTDVIRIQSRPELLDQATDIDLSFSQKMDGTPATLIWNDGRLRVCSQNLEITRDTDSVYWKVADDMHIADRLAGSKARALALQGEICGPGIQSNRSGLYCPTFFLFDIYDISAGKYLPVNEMITMADGLGISTVPIINDMGLPNVWSIDSLEAFAEKGVYTPSGHPQEGIVARSSREIFSTILEDRFRFKVVSKKYLMRE